MNYVIVLDIEVLYISPNQITIGHCTHATVIKKTKVPNQFGRNGRLNMLRITKNYKDCNEYTQPEFLTSHKFSLSSLYI